MRDFIRHLRGRLRLRTRLRRLLAPGDAGGIATAQPAHVNAAARLTGGFPVTGRPPYEFSPDARELWINTPEPPHPARNILYNDAYFTIIDQTAAGQGRHMTHAGRKNNLIENERLLYVRDDATGDYFSVAFAPVYHPCDHWRCRQGLNWQTIETTAAGLRVIWRIYVPAGADPVEIWDVQVEAAGNPLSPRRVSLFACVSMKCDGEDLDCGDLYRIARYDPAREAIFVRMDAERHQSMDHPFHNGFAASHPAPASWDASPGPFFGARRTAANPAAGEAGACSGSHQAMWPPVAALHVRLDLPKTAAARFLFGACDREPMIATLRAKYLCGTLAADPHFDATLAAQEALTGRLSLATPEPSVDQMLSAWVPKQIHLGATWGRWGWRGYRDVLQQSVGVLTIDPGLARANILEACTHQYASGFALRGWRPVDAKRYADSAQWLIPAVTEYLKETGDFRLLDEMAPFFDGVGVAGSTKNGAQPPSAARSGDVVSAPVLDHLERAMCRLYEDRGAHGLCLAFGGDWNDSLTGVCRAGRGESVWLSMAFCRDALLMGELFTQCDRAADAARYAAWHAEVAEAINRHGWDGEWYRCALDDDGNPIGSNMNDEGKLFLNMQCWAQLGGVLPRADAQAPGEGDARWASAFGAVERHLNTGWGLALSWPAYTRPRANVGRMSYVRPGAAVNASVYTHGNAFMMMALLERGQADRALQLWRDIIPNNPARPGACQPNVFFNGFYGPDSEIMPGLADHAWMTGSCAWMHYGIIEMMLGLRRTYDGLVIRPCLPSAWPEARATRIYRGVTYDVTILNPARREAAPVMEILVDNQPHPPEAPLPLKGPTHKVQVRLAE